MTVHSMKSKKGQSVVALDTAEDVGEVKHFVVSRDASTIERLHIAGRKKDALFTRWADLEAFGDDRVTIKQESAAAKSDDERDLESAKGDIEILGSRILDTAGFEHGTVDDVAFDGESGSIVSITSSNGDTTSAEHLRSLGSYALVIDAAS